MIKSLLIELEKIKDIQSKKAFLKTALKSYSEKKTIDKINSMIIELEKIEKENSESKSKIDDNIISQRLEQITNNVSRMTITNVEEAPKYDPNISNNFNNQSNRQDSRLNSESLEDIASNQSNLNPRNIDNERPLTREINQEDNLTDYIASFSNSSNERASNVKTPYKNLEDFRRSVEKIDIDLLRSENYVRPIMRTTDYIVNNPEERENLKWTSNINIDHRRIESIEDSKYSADVVENIKKQKKHFEKEYI